jgi:hypothetical protein
VTPSPVRDFPPSPSNATTPFWLSPIPSPAAQIAGPSSTPSSNSLASAAPSSGGGAGAALEPRHGLRFEPWERPSEDAPLAMQPLPEYVPAAPPQPQHASEGAPVATQPKPAYVPAALPQPQHAADTRARLCGSGAEAPPWTAHGAQHDPPSQHQVPGLPVVMHGGAAQVMAQARQHATLPPPPLLQQQHQQCQQYVASSVPCAAPGHFAFQMPVARPAGPGSGPTLSAPEAALQVALLPQAVTPGRPSTLHVSGGQVAPGPVAYQAAPQSWPVHMQPLSAAPQAAGMMYQPTPGWQTQVVMQHGQLSLPAPSQPAAWHGHVAPQQVWLAPGPQYASQYAPGPV